MPISCRSLGVTLISALPLIKWYCIDFIVLVRKKGSFRGYHLAFPTTIALAPYTKEQMRRFSQLPGCPRQLYIWYWVHGTSEHTVNRELDHDSIYYLPPYIPTLIKGPFWNRPQWFTWVSLSTWTQFPIVLEHADILLSVYGSLYRWL